MNCYFCNGEMKFIYKIEKYDIVQCQINKRENSL